MQVVWFKKDLRVADHRPLFEAAKSGASLCVYIYEPELLQSPEFDSSHLGFINESLQELRHSLHALGGSLILRVGEATSVFSTLHTEFGIDTVWSHEETGNAITYARDLRVNDWLRQQGIPWREFPQTGVIRRLKNRDGWSRSRNQFMAQELIPVPTSICFAEGIEAGSIQEARDLGLEKSQKKNLIKGGERIARELLNSFLSERGQNYSRKMSSPVSAHDACSRLSSSITWGCISIRQVVHALRERQREIREVKQEGQATGGWLSSLKSFDARLSWHCHFMQKLEDQPSIEFENMSRVYDGLRESEYS